MNVSIVGSGYVGTTVAACLADLGHEVVNVDIDEAVVEAINAGDAPIHEAGLAERIERNAGEGLRATTDYDAVVETDLTLLCLPTPSRADGSIDLAVMEAGAEALGEALAAKDGRHAVVTKSTVVPGTTDGVIGPAVAEASGKTVGEDLGLGMNPEFLRMSTAVSDFLEPDKVVFGTEQPWVRDLLAELYAPVTDGVPVVNTGLREAEMIKYANNAMLASKVSLVNELGNVCKELGVDAYDVFDAVGLDDRISDQFLRSGLGWGGSCFPKDVDAVRAVAREQGYEPELLDAVVAVNDLQPRRMVDLLADHVDPEGARVAVLGVAFKPGTDDVRGSRGMDLVGHLRDRGADVVAYDPVATENAREKYPDVTYADSAAAALDGADAAMVATEWPEFDDLDFSGMARKVLIDGRRIDVDENELEVYEGLTW
ncbi:UDP-glucose 6-dehydrogenase AglM [Halostella litorea]|uniref:UDP-glucose 6-dehydrogenase AglM n=1 Tax=Halostella litorea TaxID=2528831 RepID=UPI001092A932|nr:UDP-glucose 6-dehydrogenase AglM [Halostella litorea]